MIGNKLSTLNTRRSSSAEPDLRFNQMTPIVSVVTHGERRTVASEIQGRAGDEVDNEEDYQPDDGKVVHADDVSDEEELEAMLRSVRFARQQQQLKRRRMSDVLVSGASSNGNPTRERDNIR